MTINISIYQPTECTQPDSPIIFIASWDISPLGTLANDLELHIIEIGPGSFVMSPLH